MKFWVLLFLTYFSFPLSHGYVFTNKPEEIIWGIEGESLQLECAVDESWQVFFHHS